MFVKMLASVLVLTGTLGYGYCMNRESMFQIRQLETQRRILTMMQGEIMHFHRSFPDTCQMIAEKCEEPYALFLTRVAEQMNTWQGESLEQIWKAEMEKNFSLEKFKHCILNFADLAHGMNCQESTMQIQTIAYTKEAIEEHLHHLKKEYMQNRKLTLWLSGIAGFVCIVLFI